MEENPQYKLEVFEGPLDLLLSLISKNKIDIYDIPIALVLDQYMEYIDRMQMMNMEIAGEFIVMASELMLIKSRMLLPKPVLPQDEEDPRAQLARALVEYQRAKEAAKDLGQRYQTYAGRIIKEQDVLEKMIDPPTDLETDLLVQAMSRILNRNRDLPKLAKESENTIGRMLNRKIVSVSEKIIGLMRYLYRHRDVSLEYLLLMSESRSELVATFSAILELARAQRIILNFDNYDPMDNGTNADIIVNLSLKHFSRKDNQ